MGWDGSTARKTTAPFEHENIRIRPVSVLKNTVAMMRPRSGRFPFWGCSGRGLLLGGPLLGAGLLFLRERLRRKPLGALKLPHFEQR